MSRTRKARVLLVEDHLPDVHMVTKVLSSEHADLTVVPDGVAALQYLKGAGPFSSSNPPDLVLLDLNLPRVNGLEVLEAASGSSLTPIVILTSSEAPEDIQAAYAAGCKGYLVKPHDVASWRKLARAIDTYWFEAGRLPS